MIVLAVEVLVLHGLRGGLLCITASAKDVRAVCVHQQGWPTYRGSAKVPLQSHEQRDLGRSRDALQFKRGISQA